MPCCCCDSRARQLSISSLDSDQLASRICEMHAHLKSWYSLSAACSSPRCSARMASASCAGPLPPYPHSKPVGLWLRSARRGLRGLRWPFPSMTQTTHPSGPRQPAYTFLLHGRCSAVLVSAFIVLPFMGSKTPPAGRFATTGQGRRAPNYACYGWLALSGGAAGALARRPLRRRERKRQRFSVHFSSTGTFSDPALMSAESRERNVCVRWCRYRSVDQ